MKQRMVLLGIMWLWLGGSFTLAWSEVAHRPDSLGNSVMTGMSTQVIGKKRPVIFPTFNHSDHSSLAPFPADFFTVADESLRSCNGRRLAFNAGDIPRASGLQKILPLDLINMTDGFSPIGNIVINFSGRVDPQSLPLTPAAQHDRQSGLYLVNIDPDSPALGDFIDFRADVDEPGEQALPPSYNIEIEPLFPLDPCTTYAVILTNRLHDMSGQPLGRDARFNKVIGTPGYDYIARAMAFATDSSSGLGLKASDIILAFTFSTRSEPAITRDMIRVHDLLVREATENPPDYTLFEAHPGLLEAETPGDTPLPIFMVKGHFDSPSFKGPDGVFLLDSDGQPYYQKKEQLEFLMIMPQLQKGRQAPLMVYQHGFGSQKEEMYGTILRQAVEAGFALVAIDLYGHGSRSSHNIPGVGYMADFVDIENLPASRDSFRQSAADLLELFQLIKASFGRIDLLPAGSGGDGTPDLALGDLYYTGVSLGTFVGTIVNSLEPQIRATTFYVPGGGIPNVLLDRESWKVNAGFWLDLTLAPAASEDILTMANLVQLVLDPADPLNYADHLIRHPWPGNKPKHLLIVEAIGDSVVPNPTTEDLARAIGVEQVLPYVDRIEDIAAKPAPVSENLLTSWGYPVTAGLFQFPHSDHIQVCVDPRSHKQVAYFFASMIQEGRPVIMNPLK